MNPHLCDFEWEILEDVAKDRPARPWGAAIGEALEVLACRGLIHQGQVTAKGLLALKERTSYPQPDRKVGNEGEKP